MKNYLVLAVCLLYISTAFSQNFAVYNPDREYTYQTTNGVLNLGAYEGDFVAADCEDCFLGVRLDSSESFATEEHYYLTKMIRRDSTNSYDYCAQGGIMGHRVIVRDDGTTILFNGNNDSIFIKPFLGDGVEWRMYELGNGDYLSASIAYDEMYYALEEYDLLKWIEIQA